MKKLTIDIDLIEQQYTNPKNKRSKKNWTCETSTPSFKSRGRSERAKTRIKQKEKQTVHPSDEKARVNVGGVAATKHSGLSFIVESYLSQGPYYLGSVDPDFVPFTEQILEDITVPQSVKELYIQNTEMRRIGNDSRLYWYTTAPRFSMKKTFTLDNGHILSEGLTNNGIVDIRVEPRLKNLLGLEAILDTEAFTDLSEYARSWIHSRTEKRFFNRLIDHTLLSAIEILFAPPSIWMDAEIFTDNSGHSFEVTAKRASTGEIHKRIISDKSDAQYYSKVYVNCLFAQLSVSSETLNDINAGESATFDTIWHQIVQLIRRNSMARERIVDLTYRLLIDDCINESDRDWESLDHYIDVSTSFLVPVTLKKLRAGDDDHNTEAHKLRFALLIKNTTMDGNLIKTTYVFDDSNSLIPKEPLDSSLSKGHPFQMDYTYQSMSYTGNLYRLAAMIGRENARQFFGFEHNKLQSETVHILEEWLRLLKFSCEDSIIIECDIEDQVEIEWALPCQCYDRQYFDFRHLIESGRDEAELTTKRLVYDLLCKAGEIAKVNNDLISFDRWSKRSMRQITIELTNYAYPGISNRRLDLVVDALVLTEVIRRLNLTNLFKKDEYRPVYVEYYDANSPGERDDVAIVPDSSDEERSDIIICDGPEVRTFGSRIKAVRQTKFRGGL